MITAHSPLGNQQELESAGLVDPFLLEIARLIYRAYLEVNLERMERPSGVVINPYNYRGQLVFSPQPILLPKELFIKIESIETPLY